MPVTVSGQTYYRTAEVCRMVGISRNTLFRWLKEGRIIDVEHRDYRRWRLFTGSQVEAMKKRTSEISTVRCEERARDPVTAVPFSGSGLGGREAR